MTSSIQTDSIKGFTRRLISIVSHPASISAGLGLTILFLFQPLFHAGFTGYDDPDYVTANPHVLTGITIKNVRWALFTGHADNWHPLTWISHMLDCQLFGLNAGAHHLTNVIFHVTNTVLLFLWLNRITGKKWRSAFVAALFALHPLHVQSVAWIAERKDVLSTLFWMLTIWSYTIYVRKGRDRVLYANTLFLFILGLMAKPMLVTLPCVMLLIDYWPLQRFAKMQWRTLLIEKLPFFAVSAASCIITLIVQRKQAIVPFTTVPFPLRAANAVFAYIAYIGKMFCPVRLAIIYPYNLHPSYVQVAATAVSLVLISIYSVVLSRRSPYLLTGWLWFIGTLVPVIGIIQVGAQAMADRYTYIPMIGLFIIIAWGAHDLFAALDIPIAARSICALLTLTVCASVSRMQLPYWQDSIALFEHAIETTANNDIAQINLGVALAKQQRHDEAISHYSAALQIQPRSPKAWNDLGLSLVATGRLNEAVIAYQRALHFDPAYADAHDNLGAAFGQIGNYDAAISQFKASLRLKPDDAGAENNLAIILGRAGRFDEAVSFFSDALRLDPKGASTMFNLGNLYMNYGKPEEAVTHYSDALRLMPEFVEARCNMATALMSEGRLAEAIQQLSAAIKLKPDCLPALNSLAWIYATNSDPQFQNSPAAILLAEKACKISGYKQCDELDTLGAAYASAGRFPDALRIAREASEFAKSSGQAQLALYIEKRIALYNLSQPYRAATATKQRPQPSK